MTGEENNLTTVEADGGGDSDSDSDDDMFKPVNMKSNQHGEEGRAEDTAAVDCGKFSMDDEDLAEWEDEVCAKPLRLLFNVPCAG